MPNTIYNELRSHKGKLSLFAKHLVDKGIYTNVEYAINSLRQRVNLPETIQELYEAWKPGKLKTKDMETYVKKTKEVFKEIKIRTVKYECEAIVETLEEALMELTLSIRKKDSSKLPLVKELLEAALYGPKDKQ